VFDEFARNLGHALRLLKKALGFTATALGTLAVCLGANLTIFASIDAIQLRPLPFPEAGRLVTVYNSYPKAGVDRDGSSLTNYYERRGRIPALAALAIYRFGTAVTGEAGAAEREPVAQVSPDFFATLGSRPAMGRSFTEEETSFRNDRVVILTDEYWRQHFNSDPNVTGRQLRVGGVPNIVVGVLPPGLRFLSSEARLYLPLASRLEDRSPARRHSGGNVTQMIARLEPGATIEQAQAQIDAQNATLEAGNPLAKMMADAGFRYVVALLHADHVARVRPILLAMQAGALALLLIGVVNLLNLLLIRANSRVKEIAVRPALGAGRRHVLNEVIVETTLLTAGGGLLGLAAGAAGIRLLAVLGADRLPLGTRIAFDARLAGLAFLGSVALGLALAISIAWFNLRSRLTNAIQSETRGGTSSRTVQHLRHGFVVAQVALSTVLLAAAGLLGLSLERAIAVAPGFRPDHVLTGQISLPGNKYPDWATRLAFNERLLEELAHQPGVAAAGLVNNVPFSGDNGKSAATVKGYTPRPGESPRGHYAYGVDGDYFHAMGFSLRAGRLLTADDSRHGKRVCVVDEDFARHYWPYGRAVGQRVFARAEASSDAEAFTVAGVVGAVKPAGLTGETAQGAIYYPYESRTDTRLFVAVRTSLPPESLGLALQNAVRRADPEAPVSDIRTMENRIAGSLVARRSPALLAGIFSGFALLLTVVGAYGVLSYAVAQRRREIGVRMAPGARPEQIRDHFLVVALRLLAAGTSLGIAGAALTGHALRTLLFQVPPLNGPILGAAAGVIGAVSLAACLRPSYRAARTSPLEALAGQ
jgi:predicted permease